MKKKTGERLQCLPCSCYFYSSSLTPGAGAHPYYDGVAGPLVIAHQGGDGIWLGDTLFGVRTGRRDRGGCP
ncbi:MAG: hypothetical protein MZV64_23270 [Ignavibacteriales bacterium]|nr:hypothetical protein [Ignavibacteriales bacterium]